MIRDGLANPAALDTIYQWDALSQSWLSWRFTDLAFLNTLTSLGSNQPLFLTLSQSTTYAGPLLAYGAGAWALTAGFTTIAFLGENGTSLETALAQIAFPPAIDVIFRYSNLTQTYQTYRRTGPTFLNDLLTLNRFDVLFVKTSTPTAWAFDAFTLTGPEPQRTHTLALLAGTNALTYSGEAGASPAVIRDGLANPAALDTIYQWDALSQSWLSWRFTDLAFLNTLTSLGSNQPLFLTLSQSTTYAGPLLAYGAGAWGPDGGLHHHRLPGRERHQPGDGLSADRLPAHHRCALPLQQPHPDVSNLPPHWAGLPQRPAHAQPLRCALRQDQHTDRLGLRRLPALSPAAAPFPALHFLGSPECSARSNRCPVCESDVSLWPWRWPPSLFFGSVDGLTVDGGPYDGVTPIELINADGDVVSTANVAEGVWSVQAPPDAGTVRLRVGDAVSEQEFAVQSAALVEVESATLVTPVEQVVRSVDLNAGFQALTHSGAELPVADFLQLFASPAAVDGIFLWDILDQGWTSWRAGLPDPLQAVSVIGQNTPMLLLLNAATTYSSEVLAHQSGEWSIINGLTSMAFLGPR